MAKSRKRKVSFGSAGRDGVDESRVRGAAGNTLPPPSGIRAVSLASTFVLLGVKPPPKLSATASTGGEGALKRPRGCPDEGKEASEQPHGREKQHQASPSNASPRGRGGGKGASFPSKGLHDVCRDDTAEKKAAEQAAKMAERRQRCVGYRASTECSTTTFFYFLFFLVTRGSSEIPVCHTSCLILFAPCLSTVHASVETPFCLPNMVVRSFCCSTACFRRFAENPRAPSFR